MTWSDYIIGSRLEALEASLAKTYLLQTPDAIYDIKDNVIVPAWIEVNQSWPNLVLSYWDNSLIPVPVLETWDLLKINKTFSAYATSSFMIFGSLFVVFFAFRLFKRFV
mgnify:FL=1